jgi:hypothetical protein
MKNWRNSNTAIMDRIYPTISLTSHFFPLNVHPKIYSAFIRTFSVTCDVFLEASSQTVVKIKDVQI